LIIKDIRVDKNLGEVLEILDHIKSGKSYRGYKIISALLRDNNHNSSDPAVLTVKFSPVLNEILY
jgi:hypothetical protein